MKSIIQDKKECFFCRLFEDRENTVWLEKHHIMGGADRTKSERYGLTVYLCHRHHNEPPDGVHHNYKAMCNLRAYGQKQFEKTHSHEEFMKIFGRNYL